jgi:hypothetical protein
MRVFKNESLYNQETQEWEEFYEIDGLRVDVDTFAEQAEIEELVTEEDEDTVIQCDCPDCVEARRLEQEDSELELCYCQECNEEREDKLITECLDQVFDQCCIDCTIDKIVETLYKFKELGKLEAKEEMKEFLEY